MSVKTRPASDHANYAAAMKIAKAGKFTSWLRSWQDVCAVTRGCYFDADAGRRSVDFFQALKQSKGVWGGQPLKLMDWQINELNMPLFGWKLPDGTRRFRRAYIEIPKKNGKSTWAAAFALYMLLADREPGAEVFSAAKDSKQASLVFTEAKRMVRKSDLSDIIQIIESTKTMNWGDCLYRALPGDEGSVEGLNISALVFDELHVQKNRQFWDSLVYGDASRTQPLMVSITTAGIDRQSICYEEHELARQCIEGTQELIHFMAFIAGADEDDDWTDPVVWKKANPSLGITISEETFARHCEEAKASPAKINSFRRYRLNIWTQGEDAWIDTERWNACAAAYTESDLLGRVCYGGLDLASTNDLAAFMLVFPPMVEGEPEKCLTWNWVPENNIIQRSLTSGVSYDLWHNTGELLATPGDAIDHSAIKDVIVQCANKFDIKKIAFDRWGAAGIVAQLHDEGIDLVGFGQGFASMAGPTSDLIRVVQLKEFAHPNHPVLNWCSGNMILQEDAAGNLKPDKAHSREKIDPMVALVMAHGLAMTEKQISDAELFETTTF